MNKEIEAPPNPRDSLKLKLPEPDVSSEQPWQDDVLDRKQIAERLTNLIENQRAPFSISIHGNWGTGKTFLLKRWRNELENQKFRAIYFNAWEDDFCEDPLLAILGQLAEYFKESKLESFSRTAMAIAMPLIRKNALSVLNKATGITFELELEGQNERDFVEEYLSQRASKDKLKGHLKKMSASVVEETGRPLVVIIDELDRCRPTFAIELLERVKHIFDVPNLVFVFGLNRNELCASIRSIYGEIDADTYLRRFFDMEFNLPEPDSGTFGRHLMQKFVLDRFFADLSKSDFRGDIHYREYRVLANAFPILWDRLGLSLRDIDYCVRSIALVGRNLELLHTMVPWLLGPLIALRLKNPNLYRQFIVGNCRGSEVVNYLDSIIPPVGSDSNLANLMDRIEAYLYFAGDERAAYHGSSRSTALSQLRRLQSGEALTHPDYLSERTQSSDKNRAISLINIVQTAGGSWPLHRDVVGYLGELIDLPQSMVRR